MLSILYYLFTLLQVTFWFIVSIVVLIVTYPFDKSRYWVHWCSRCICATLFGVPPRMRRTIEGLENVDKNKSYVMVINHNSGFDIFASYIIPLNFRWVSKKEVFWVPFMGPLLYIHGDIPINRGNAAAAMAKVIEDGKLWLSRGASVAIFPEGTRSKDGKLGEFKGGAMKIAMESRAKVVPVLIEGSRARLEETGNITKGTVYVTFLPPIVTEGLEKDDFFKMPAQIREMIQNERDKQTAEKQ